MQQQPVMMQPGMQPGMGMGMGMGGMGMQPGMGMMPQQQFVVSYIYKPLYKQVGWTIV